MGRTAMLVGALIVGLALGIPLGGRLGPPLLAPAAAPSAAFAAVPNAIGAQDVSGPYEVVEGWPQDLSTLPGHEKWTYGGARGIFAESPNRVFLLGGGELQDRPSADTAVSRDWPERAVSACGIAVAQREHGVAARSGRLWPGPGERDGNLARRISSVP